VAVLNEHRQILSISEAFAAMAGARKLEDILGLRPGEAIACVFSREEADGCGTARACATCGAAISIVSALCENLPVERACVATVEAGEGSMDLFLLVRAFPVDVGGARYVILFLRDTTEEQNRAAFDRIFYHDLRNVLSAITGTVSLIEDDHTADGELVDILASQVSRLTREVELGSLLVQGKGDLPAPRLTRLRAGSVLSEVQTAFTGHPTTKGRTILLDSSAAPAEITADHQILQRVLANMVVNALEATPEGGEIRITARTAENELEIGVWNRASIPREVAPRVFQRNFSTKSQAGRGLGTYSMKLLTERYLQGRVGFTTSPEGGTTFTVALPVDPERPRLG
jgi:signal transduction histidine kinase